MTVREWLTGATAALRRSGCPDPEVDAAWMAEEALGMTRFDLKFEGHQPIDDAPLSRLQDMLLRRCDGEPLQYILRRADFMGLQFYVDRRVLIPRQDTETLVEFALTSASKSRTGEALDLCTGSGCVGLSLKSLAPHLEMTLTDLSREALEVARINATALELDVSFKHGDLFSAVRHRRFDLILSNPPYIPHRDLQKLQTEVQREPQMALDGGADGLEFYRRIAEGMGDHLKSRGLIALEVGLGQAQQVLELLNRQLKGSEGGIVKDLNGIDRVVWLRKS